jgi:hypothetical protein
MTYWPISSPSVFAATKSSNLARTPASHDGLDQPSRNGRDDASGTESANDTDDDVSTRRDDGLKEETKDQGAHEPHVLDQFAEEDVHGEIIAIRVTRSGQLFATLTRTTLTIWQTKVFPLVFGTSAVLMHNPAHRYSSLSPTLATVAEDVRSEHRRPTSTRLPDIRRSDHTWFLDHILPCDRPLVPRVQNPIHRHTRSAFEKKQCNNWVQDTAPA